jgi:hypothetical protein
MDAPAALRVFPGNIDLHAVLTFRHPISIVSDRLVKRR